LIEESVVRGFEAFDDPENIELK
jgi:hypothetical protein